MYTIPGGKAVKHCNAYKTYQNGPGGKISTTVKGPITGGLSLARDAINAIPGTKITNKLLSPGPKHRKHY